MELSIGFWFCLDRCWYQSCHRSCCTSRWNRWRQHLGQSRLSILSQNELDHLSLCLSIHHRILRYYRSLQGMPIRSRQFKTSMHHLWQNHPNMHSLLHRLHRCQWKMCWKRLPSWSIQEIRCLSWQPSRMCHLQWLCRMYPMRHQLHPWKRCLQQDPSQLCRKNLVQCRYLHLRSSQW